MTLDVRAARASASIRSSVAGAVPVGIPGVVGRRRASLVFGFAVAAVIALGSLAFASVVMDHDQDLAATTLPDSSTLPGGIATGDGHTGEVDPGPDGVTATQQNTESDSPEPFAKFTGTAPAGTVILASSSYGSADTVAGEGGTWVLTLAFNDPPHGETFPVILTVGDQRYEFPFTSYWDPDVEISAHQTLGSSDSAEPYEQFYGTAPAGTAILVTSEYGSADGITGEHGEWTVEVRFHEAPRHEPFGVKVTVGDHTFPFTFTWLRTDPETTTTTTEPKPPTRSIHQYNTQSESPEPYIKIYGTAPAGTHVLMQSEYGASDMVVEGNGEFSLKLWFSPLPPSGVEFPVTVKINHEYYTTYHFTSWFDPSDATITVDQYNTETDSPEPYGKFTGTAPIGTHIVLQSEYGATEWNTEAVNWTGKLFFSTLPPSGVPFNITVKINGDVFGTYQFTSWYAPSGVEIAAHRSLGSSAESPPYDVYYGTAPAGTVVHITSEYSEPQEFTVGESGSWEKKVFFPDSPLGTEIDVAVTVGDQVFHFGFIHVTG